MERNFKLIEDVEFLQMLADVASDAQCSTQRYRRLTNYVYPNTCKNVVLWKDRCKCALDIYSDEVWTTATITYS